MLGIPPAVQRPYRSLSPTPITSPSLHTYNPPLYKEGVWGMIRRGVGVGDKPFPVWPFFTSRGQEYLPPLDGSFSMTRRSILRVRREAFPLGYARYSDDP